MSLTSRLLGLSGERAAAPVQRTAPSVSTGNVAWATPNMPMTAEWDAETAVSVGYYGHVYAYRCARTIATTIAGLPFRAGPDPDKPGTFNTNAPLARLLGPPPGGPAPSISPRQLWIWSIVSYLVTGRFAWETPSPAGSQTPASLWPLVAAKLKPVPTDGGAAWFSGFEYSLNAQPRTLTPRQVFYAWRPSQKDWRQPESVLQAAALPLGVGIALDRYMAAFMRNGMVGAKMVLTPGFEDNDMRRAFQDQFLSEMSGVENAGRTAFAEWEDDGAATKTPSVQVVDLGTKPVDAQIIELLKWVRDTVCDSFGVPVSIVGNSSERTYENADQEHRNYWTGAILPMLAELADHINIDLAPRLGDDVGWFDVSRVEALRPARRFMQASPDVLVQAGIVAVAEVREDLSLPPQVPTDPNVPPPPDPLPAIEDTPGVAIGGTSGGRATADADTVYAYLRQNYPARVLGWVHDARWSLENAVPLTKIKMARRPGARDPEKVQGIADAIRAGKTMQPVVLVDTGEDKYEIADGYHRTLAFEKAGRKTITAYIGSGAGMHGPWETAMHDAKLNRGADAVLAQVREALLAVGRDDQGHRVADKGHPVATERLMAYWSEGAGAAKIQWGVAGDFNRCRLHLGKYVRPDEVDGLCANLHHRATGAWPGHAPSEQGRDATLVTETGPSGAGALLPVAGKPLSVPHPPTRGAVRGICGTCGKPVKAKIHMTAMGRSKRAGRRHAGPGHARVPTGHLSHQRKQTIAAVHRHADSLEPAMEQAMRGVFDAQRKATIDRLNGNRGKQMLRAAQPPTDGPPAPVVDASQVFDLQHWVTRTQDAVAPVYAAVGSLARDRMTAKFGADSGSTIAAVQDALTTRARRLADTVSRTTLGQLVKVLQDGLAHGQSLADITNAVAAVFNDATTSRAPTIARTEVLGALATASDSYAKAAGPAIVAGKEWLSAHDDRVRPAHRIADGQVRTVTAPFMVGGIPMEHPGDPAAPPDETVNCRCVTAYLTPAEYAKRTTTTLPIAA